VEKVAMDSILILKMKLLLLLMQVVAEVEVLHLEQEV